MIFFVFGLVIDLLAILIWFAIRKYVLPFTIILIIWVLSTWTGKDSIVVFFEVLSLLATPSTYTTKTRHRRGGTNSELAQLEIDDNSSKLGRDIGEFTATFTIKQATKIISAQNGGMAKLVDGATLQVRPESFANTTKIKEVSISVLPPSSVKTCIQHDNMEGGTPGSVYNCLPHGGEFSKPVLLSLPYNTSLPLDQQAVFHMKTDANGNPCGSWTMVDAQFNGSAAVFLTNHFSYYSVFYFQDANFRKKAKITRAKNIQDTIYPGLTCRGTCKNPTCAAVGSNVNCSFGFGEFKLATDINTSKKNSRIKCPICATSFAIDKLVFHDTQVSVTYKENGVPYTKNEVVWDSDAVCMGIGKKGSQQKMMEDLVVVCTPRQGSHFGIDICFVIDCTGSMEPHLEAATTQSKEIARTLQEEVKQLGMKCTVRIAFVAYRDYITRDDGSYETPDDIVYSADFTEDLSSIVTHMGSQRAYGGGDACENVVGGLQEAVKLNWMGSMRALVLIADAPCHGTEFHNNEVDYFPQGDPEGNHPRTFLSQMLRKNINFFFLRITNRTDTMIQQFRKYYESDQENAKNLRISVMQMGQDTDKMGKLIKEGIMKRVVAFSLGNF